MLEYDRYGRMAYNSELHFNQGKPWDKEDLEYLIQWYDIIGMEEMGLALGRTEATVADKVSKLRKAGIMPKSTKRFHLKLLRGDKDVQAVTT
ncbi:hypothetical protein PMY56_13450 [Clostridium tertium]|uniref:hypothetical protein n=1 Tax=Clostridium TaxID=1485 RepID=UPI002330E4BA|nr:MULTISPECIES: hypothetical protein [Clostridium]MDB1924097.1 hypothetical protein [Clostridium tertium]MDB1927142.1 hypothetical protein [Clostridium tertium]MDB1930919.1 hypothetical protein [Clostridium tertium]MDU1279167.1 hypothetical protein [Clostridium sp.]